MPVKRSRAVRKSLWAPAMSSLAVAMSVLIDASSLCEVGCSSFRWRSAASWMWPWSNSASTCWPDCRYSSLTLRDVLVERGVGRLGLLHLVRAAGRRSPWRPRPGRCTWRHRRGGAAPSPGSGSAPSPRRASPAPGRPSPAHRSARSMRSFICRMTTRLSSAIATSSRAPVRKPKSSLRWTPAFTRATASTTGRSQPVKRGIFGSAGVITGSRAISGRRSQSAVIGSIRHAPISAGQSPTSNPRDRDPRCVRWRLPDFGNEDGVAGIARTHETAPSYSRAMISAAESGQHQSRSIRAREEP